VSLLASLDLAGASSSPSLVYKTPPVPFAYDWSGLYLGGDGGFGWETAKGTLTDAAGAPLTAYNYRVIRPVAGLFVGGSYQLNRVVLGAEADWQSVQPARQ
jgi:outer membrane immunogenic protein